MTPATYEEALPLTNAADCLTGNRLELDDRDTWKESPCGKTCAFDASGGAKQEVLVAAGDGLMLHVGCRAALVPVLF